RARGGSQERFLRFRRDGVLLPQPAVEFTVLAGTEGTPLLVEERHPSPDALVSEAARPVQIHQTVLCSTLSASNEPRQIPEPLRSEGDRSEKRLSGDEGHRCWDTEKLRDESVRVVLYSHARADPHVGQGIAKSRRVAVVALQESPEAVGALRKDLVGVAGSLGHHVEEGE